MDQILQTLLTMTTTASVAAPVRDGTPSASERAPRWITCLLWMVVFVRMVCPVSFSLPVSLVPAPHRPGHLRAAGWAGAGGLLPRPGACPWRTPAARQTKGGLRRAGPDRCGGRTLWAGTLGHAPFGAFPPPSAPADRGSHPARGQPL